MQNYNSYDTTEAKRDAKEQMISSFFNVRLIYRAYPEPKTMWIPVMAINSKAAEDKVNRFAKDEDISVLSIKAFGTLDASK